MYGGTLMYKAEAVKLIQSGHISAFNQYRTRHPDWLPDLSEVDLSNCILIETHNSKFPEAIDLHGANLCGTKLPTSESAYQFVFEWQHIKQIVVPNFKC